MGQARFLPPARLARSQSGHDGETRLQPYRARPGADDAVRYRTAPDPRLILCVRRCGDVLPVHEICPSVHLLLVQHHSSESGRSFAERLGNPVRDTSYGEFELLWSSLTDRSKLIKRISSCRTDMKIHMESPTRAIYCLPKRMSADTSKRSKRVCSEAISRQISRSSLKPCRW